MLWYATAFFFLINLGSLWTHSTILLLEIMNLNAVFFFLNELQDGFYLSLLWKSDVPWICSKRTWAYQNTLKKKEFKIRSVSCCVDNAALFVYRNSPTVCFGSVDLVNCTCLVVSLGRAVYIFIFISHF